MFLLLKVQTAHSLKISNLAWKYCETSWCFSQDNLEMNLSNLNIRYVTFLFLSSRK